MSKPEALKLEFRIKRMPSDQKISGLNTLGREIEIKRNLQSLRRDFKAIVKLIDNLIKGI